MIKWLIIFSFLSVYTYDKLQAFVRHTACGRILMNKSYIRIKTEG